MPERLSKRDPVCGMPVGPETALSLEHGSEEFFFCSRRCVEKFAEGLGLTAQELSSVVRGPRKRKRFFLNKSFLSVVLLAGLMGISYAVPALVPFRESVARYLQAIGWALFLGFLVGGLLERYVPREYISLVLARKRKRTILFSVALGFLMSACSHGILALSIELHKKGASTPVVVSFLLASPWANLPVTLMLMVFFGWKALYIILGALLVAFVTGLVFQFLEGRGLVEANQNTVAVDRSFSIRRDLKRRWAGSRFSFKKIRRDGVEVLRGAFALADMVLCWVLLGIALSGLASALIPAAIFQKTMGPSFLGLLATLGLATVMEVCSEGTAPLAFEIFKQTGAFGNAFVFLMAGIVTDISEISLIWANVGRRTALFIPLVAVPQVVALGILANKIF